MYFIICDLQGTPIELVTSRDQAWVLAYHSGDTIEEYSDFKVALDRMRETR
jgi:hypothetical protein